MGMESKSMNGERGNTMEDFSVRLTDAMLYDRLHVLSAEYSISAELLVNAAVKKLLDDVDFVRSLRAGEIERI